MVVFRSRVSVPDAAILLALCLAATLFAFEYDFFQNADRLTVHERRITVAEFFSLTGLFIVGLIVYAARRLREQRREFERRLAAEGDVQRALGEAMRDSLTGLPNRRALYGVMAATLEHTTDAEQHSLAMLDLNGFKAVNDRYGHLVGDKFLEQIAHRLAASKPDGCFAARLGGDEFAVFFTGVAHPDDAMQTMQRLVAVIEQPIVIEGIAHCAGVAVGLAHFPQHGRTQTELMHCADVALYRAKAEEISTVRSYAA
jgi:diguanylate cyclase (GGDEF)-like protein